MSNTSTVESKLSSDNSTLIIGVRGKFDFSVLKEFRQAYSDYEVKADKVMVDMRDTLTIDSSALGMLLNMQRFLKKGDKEISIINCNNDVGKIFQITHFNKKFSIE